MIRKLEVKGLNNRVDGTWEFNEDLNIITGRNGSGKTTLLKLIWYLISGNIAQVISDIPLQTVAIETDSFSLSMQVESNKGQFHYKFANESEVAENFEIPLRREDNVPIDEINVRITRAMNSSLFFPSFRRIEGGFARFFKYTPTNRVTKREQIRFGNIEGGSLDEALWELSDEVSHYENHKFIASLSINDIIDLLREDDTTISIKTNALYEQLLKEITQKISKANPREDETPVLEDIQKRVVQVDQERQSLRKPFSVLSQQILDIFQYPGIRIMEGITLGEENGAIESNKLSSGEKQMLSFLFYNAFHENTTIFIDEPELSLHVDWQRLLLPTLLEQETGNQFFIATHSPFIYAKYPDKEILLGEDRGGD